MKICVNRIPVKGPFGGGNLLTSAFWKLASEAGHEVVSELSEKIDVVFVIDPRVERGMPSMNDIISYKTTFPKTRVIQRVNECDARKGTNDVDTLLLDCSKVVDKTIFVSKWMQEYHVKKGWACENQAVIINGVDKTHFATVPKTWTKTRIVTHHWSDNRLKGADVYEWIDEFIARHPEHEFTYIGRTQSKFKNTKVIAPLSGKALGEALAEHDVYISGSRFDPGPNHVLEALACGLPTYVHDHGGGSVEFAGEDHKFRGPQNIYDMLTKKTWTKNSYVPTSWEECILEYLKELE
jgi:hypothetical protein